EWHGSRDHPLRERNRLREEVGRLYELTFRRISRTDETIGTVRSRVEKEVFMFGLSVPVVAGLLVLAILFAMAGFATLLRKVGPHEALIVYGIRGPRTVTNGGTILIPMLEQCHELSLELMSFDVAPQQSLYTNQGVAVTVEAVAQ